jgi:hypothetical protein
VDMGDSLVVCWWYQYIPILCHPVNLSGSGDIFRKTAVTGDASEGPPHSFHCIHVS